MPLVMALVVLPTLSRVARVALAFGILKILLGHLGDTAGVIRQGTKGVHGQVVASVGEHTDTCHGNGVHDENELMADRSGFEAADDQTNHDHTNSSEDTIFDLLGFDWPDKCPLPHRSQLKPR